MQSPRALGGALPLPQPPRHALRQRQRAVLTEMIRNAVPLSGEVAADNSASSADVAATRKTAYGVYAGHEHPYNNSNNTTASSSSTLLSAPPTVWRLLIFDDWGRDVLAPLLRVSDLRELGVTLYMHIRTERDAVAGAPAVYFCAPSEENVRCIARDCAAGLYEWVYLNFTAQIARPQLELLARELRAAQLRSIRHIRVYDRTLNFVALDEDLFTLLLPRSYEQLHTRTARDDEVQAHVEAMALGLLHVVLAQQVLPVVAHTRTGAAAAVARRLLALLADALRERQLSATPLPMYTTTTSATTTASGGSSSSRPLLLISDRESDVAAALHHPFSYRGLLVDLAHMHLNKCMVRVSATADSNSSSNSNTAGANNNNNNNSGSGNSDASEEVVEIDVDRDVFYRQHSGDNFAAIGGHIEAALRAYTSEYAALSAQSSSSSSGAGAGAGGVLGDDEDDVMGGGGGAAGGVSRLLASAPRLAERKRYLDAHTRLSYAFLHDIRTRQLDHFHGVEAAMLLREGLDKDEFARLLTAASGRVADRQRLCLVAYLLCCCAEVVRRPDGGSGGSGGGGHDGGTSAGDGGAGYSSEDAAFVQQQLSRAAASLADATAATANADNKGGFAALAYVKHLQQWSRAGVHNNNNNNNSNNSNNTAASYVGQAFAWDLAQQVARTLTSTLGSKTDTMLPLTKLVDALLQEPPVTTASAAAAAAARGPGSPISSGIGGVTGTTASSSSQRAARQRMLERVVAYEPRTGAAMALSDAYFSQAVVFVVGGGCIAEYDNLKAWEATQPRKAVCYGCTAMTTGDDMLAQLTRLGQQLGDTSASPTR